MNRFYLLLAVGWATAIFWMSSLPGTEVGLQPPWDKLAHFATYAVLATLLVRSGLSQALAFLLAVVYGAGDEWHQSFVPGRDASGFDLLADAAGALLIFLPKLRQNNK